MSNFIAGPYSATYNAKALGQVDNNGYQLSHSFFKRLITGDQKGDTPQDAIYRGREQYIDYTLIEALQTGVPDLIDPYATVLGTPLTLGNIGQMDVGYSGCTGKAQALVLTAIAGSCATPASITMPLSILYENYPVRQLYGSDLRTIPIRQRIYPDKSTGVFGTEA
jgi:hypothetical protein